MNVELLYTSAPQGLKQGSRGFCTVLSTAGMPINLAQKLEALSAYRHVYPPNDPRAKSNPVCYSTLRFVLAGKPLVVLSRIADYGFDYTQRSNKIAHHLVVDAPFPSCGPADVLARPNAMRSTWSGQCETLPAGPKIGDRPITPAICQAWKGLTGDAGWGGLLADAWMESASKPVWIIFAEEHSTRLLKLVEESTALLPDRQRWNATFSTYFTAVPPDVECRVRCVLAGTDEARMAIARGTVIDLTKRLSSAPTTKGSEAARQGYMWGGSKEQPPELPSQKSLAPTAVPSGRATEVPQSVASAPLTSFDGDLELVNEPVSRPAPSIIGVTLPETRVAARPTARPIPTRMQSSSVTEGNSQWINYAVMGGGLFALVCSVCIVAFMFTGKKEVAGNDKGAQQVAQGDPQPEPKKEDVKIKNENENVREAAPPAPVLPIAPQPSVPKEMIVKTLQREFDRKDPLERKTVATVENSHGVSLRVTPESNCFEYENGEIFWNGSPFAEDYYELKLAQEGKEKNTIKVRIHDNRPDARVVLAFRSLAENKVNPEVNTFITGDYPEGELEAKREPSGGEEQTSEKWVWEIQENQSNSSSEPKWRTLRDQDDSKLRITRDMYDSTLHVRPANSNARSWQEFTTIRNSSTVVKLKKWSKSQTKLSIKYNIQYTLPNTKSEEFNISLGRNKDDMNRNEFNPVSSSFIPEDVRREVEDIATRLFDSEQELVRKVEAAEMILKNATKQCLERKLKDGKQLDKKTFDTALKSFEDLILASKGTSKDFEMQLGVTEGQTQPTAIQREHHIISELTQIISDEFISYKNATEDIKTSLQKLKEQEKSVEGFTSVFFLTDSLRIKEELDSEDNRLVRFAIKSTIKVELPRPEDSALKATDSKKPSKSTKNTKPSGAPTGRSEGQR